MHCAVSQRLGPLDEVSVTKKNLNPFISANLHMASSLLDLFIEAIFTQSEID